MSLFLNLPIVINHSQKLYSIADKQGLWRAYVYIYKHSKGPFRCSTTVRNSSQSVGSYPSRKALISFIILYTKKDLTLTESMSYIHCSLTSALCFTTYIRNYYSKLRVISTFFYIYIHTHVCVCLDFGSFPAKKKNQLGESSNKPAYKLPLNER